MSSSTKDSDDPPPSTHEDGTVMMNGTGNCKLTSIENTALHQSTALLDAHLTMCTSATHCIGPLVEHQGRLFPILLQRSYEIQFACMSGVAVCCKGSSSSSSSGNGNGNGGDSSNDKVDEEVVEVYHYSMFHNSRPELAASERRGKLSERRIVQILKGVEMRSILKLAKIHNGGFIQLRTGLSLTLGAAILSNLERYYDDMLKTPITIDVEENGNKLRSSSLDSGKSTNLEKLAEVAEHSKKLLIEKSKAEAKMKKVAALKEAAGRKNNNLETTNSSVSNEKSLESKTMTVSSPILVPPSTKVRATSAVDPNSSVEAPIQRQMESKLSKSTKPEKLSTSKEEIHNKATNTTFEKQSAKKEIDLDKVATDVIIESKSKKRKDVEKKVLSKAEKRKRKKSNSNALSNSSKFNKVSEISDVTSRRSSRRRYSLVSKNITGTEFECPYPNCGTFLPFEGYIENSILDDKDGDGSKIRFPLQICYTCKSKVQYMPTLHGGVMIEKGIGPIYDVDEIKPNDATKVAGNEVLLKVDKSKGETETQNSKKPIVQKKGKKFEDQSSKVDTSVAQAKKSSRKSSSKKIKTKSILQSREADVFSNEEKVCFLKSTKERKLWSELQSFPLDKSLPKDMETIKSKLRNLEASEVPEEDPTELKLQRKARGILNKRVDQEKLMKMKDLQEMESERARMEASCAINPRLTPPMESYHKMYADIVNNTIFIGKGIKNGSGWQSTIPENELKKCDSCLSDQIEDLNLTERELKKNETDVRTPYVASSISCYTSIKARDKSVVDKRQFNRRDETIDNLRRQMNMLKWITDNNVFVEWYNKARIED